MATSCPGSLCVSFTDLLSLSHCPSKDSRVELLRGARHESHPNGIPVTAGIAPGSQVHPASASCLPPTLQGSSGACSRGKACGAPLGTSLGLWDVLTNPLCVASLALPSTGVRPGHVRAPLGRTAPFLMEKNLALRQGPVKPVVRAGPAGFKQTPCASSPTSWCWCRRCCLLSQGWKSAWQQQIPLSMGSTDHCLVGKAAWQDSPDLDNHRQPVTMDVHSKGGGGSVVFPDLTLC